jgi:hypothetical protein
MAVCVRKRGVCLLPASGDSTVMQPDTRKIVRTGLGIFLTGAASVLLLFTAFGGITRQGPHTNLGWLALMVAMGCVPTGTLTLMLAVAKLFADRKKPTPPGQ